jgi:hypothetical protein
MSLVEKAWTKVCVHKVILEFLLAEETTRLSQLPPDQMPALVKTQGLKRILHEADLNKAAENHTRLRLLCLIRRWLICEIPPDTEWYVVQNLSDYELSELRIIGRCGLDDWADGNEVLKARKKIHLIEAPSNWKSIILIGHTRIGPFTIVEGNNRIVAYMSSNRNGLDVPVYVGLSEMPFFFSCFDSPEKIVNDLWR